MYAAVTRHGEWFCGRRKCVVSLVEDGERCWRWNVDCLLATGLPVQANLPVARCPAPRPHVKSQICGPICQVSPPIRDGRRLDTGDSDLKAPKFHRKGQRGGLRTWTETLSGPLRTPYFLVSACSPSETSRSEDVALQHLPGLS